MSFNMSGIEFNKILASIIVTIIIFVIIGFIGNFLVKVDHNKNQETAYKIEIPETSVVNKVCAPVEVLAVKNLLSSAVKSIEV